MKKVFSILRITGLLVLAIVLAEVTLETGEQSIYEAYPIIWLILGVILLIGIAIEASVAALERTLYMSLKPDAKARYENAMAVKLSLIHI